MTDSKDCMIDTLVVLAGCDDTTRFHVECTEEEYDFLQRLSTLSSEASNSCCMPVMDVTKTRPCKYSKTYPKCGFTPTKYQKLRYAEYTGRNRIIIFNEIMKNYRNGAYGDSNITLSEIFVRAGYPNLMNDMTDEELVYLRDSSAGVLHQVFSFEISKRKAQQDSNGI